MTVEKAKEMLREILSIVAHQERDGSWWGADTDCGTDEYVMAEGIAILQRYIPEVPDSKSPAGSS